MVDTPQSNSISDDQELAKVLAGVTEAADGAASPTLSIDDTIDPSTTTPDGTTSAPTTPTFSSDDSSTDDGSDSDTSSSTPGFEMPAMPDLSEFGSLTGESSTTPEPTDTPTEAVDAPNPAPVSTGDSDLDDIKREALQDLRPLVDKLQLPSDEKFDTLLLLIRSTDDKTLIGPAHDAARQISDETRRAEALLDIIKEIDYLTNPDASK